MVDTDKVREAVGIDDDVRRRLLYSALSFVLGWMATRLALYLTNKILGAPKRIV